MKIYMIQEGWADYSILTNLGAFTTKEAAENVIKEAAKELYGAEWIEECNPEIVEVELHGI